MSERDEAVAAAEEQEAPPPGEPAAEGEPDAGDAAPAADAEPAPEEAAEPEPAPEEAAEPEPAPEEAAEPESVPEEELEPEPAVPVAVGPAAGRQATVYLCDRGHRTVAVWSTPTACHARPLRSGGECGRPLYSISALPEQVQKALNPLKASRKASKV